MEHLRSAVMLPLRVLWCGCVHVYQAAYVTTAEPEPAVEEAPAEPAYEEAPAAAEEQPAYEEQPAAVRRHPMRRSFQV